MSAFLAPVHFWMYDKIINLRNLEDELSELLRDNEQYREFLENLSKKYGDINRDESLEAIIDHSNIHGWLQKNVDIVEVRHAEVITKLIDMGVSMDKILEKTEEHAIKVANNIHQEAEKNKDNFIKSYGYDTPKEVFATINTYVLDGLPCDRVSLPIEESPNEFIWETTNCIHEKYWDSIGGDVSNYYQVRNTWINSFVQNLPKKYRYERYQDSGKTLNRVVSLEGK
ncbi:hypothetical protein BHF71_07050 [Vulcanibacillus modesticaldus]|uniref:Uncharacterized protein n=1 Tax=Vulcanibacillus modesticaldus TaxID=337097 RepID=A0A1D2YWC0_9BACI|nr:hypothetical protein [Vulcanibacillus modesticaldus]OEF99947.1 hypothetical protein BHF71_07050 [Vulcanibacillus modesticaldus]